MICYNLWSRTVDKMIAQSAIAYWPGAEAVNPNNENTMVKKCSCTVGLLTASIRGHPETKRVKHMNQNNKYVENPVV